ncbi:hypothetical protein PCANC_21658 [Puccinia coronata f. sp. avenae]|uniref:Uncharacterized protein n=1 Tax=Puccinia coronata f. sp. avenae TaxID=200324 RepID=A0A2N5SGX4_9BASI|nr:hypothetical protein PCANC_21658 [Puccinia coronata f. sp. avenae]
MDQEDADSLAWMQALHAELIQQQRFKNWTNFLGKLFPAYLHLKKQTHNWTASNFFNNFSNDAKSEFSLTFAPARQTQSSY